MKLSTILLIVGVILLLFLLLGPSRDWFTGTPNPYKISWQAPANNGGDPKCCSYDWQICNDAACTSIVDSGTTSELSVETKKLNWTTTYNIWVRASNISGKGDWTKAELSTGDGTVKSIVLGEKIDNSSGQLIKELSASVPINVMVWASLDKGSVDPNTLVGTATVTAVRSETQLFSHVIPLKSSTMGNTSTFYADFASASPTIPPVVFQKGDIIYADVYIADNKGNVVTEHVSNQIPITKTVPGGVSGITLTYSMTPPPIPFVGKYQQWINTLYSQNPSPYATVSDVASAALTQYNSMPAPTTPTDYQTKMSLFFLSQLKWAGSGATPDSMFRGIGYFYVKLNSMGWDNASMCAAFDLYRRVPADPKLAASFNMGSGIGDDSPNSTTYAWGPDGLGSQSYYTQIQNVLAVGSTTFSPNLSTSPSQICPTRTDCQTGKPVTNATKNTQICAGSGQIINCSISEDEIPYWKQIGAPCTCNM